MKRTLICFAAAALIAALPWTTSGQASVPMTAAQVLLSAGTGFWGGFVCGAAAGFLAVGTMAIVTAAGAGTTLAAGVALGTSVSLEVFAVCLAIP
jgi:hypothetical protein